MLWNKNYYTAIWKIRLEGQALAMRFWICPYRQIANPDIYDLIYVKVCSFSWICRKISTSLYSRLILFRLFKIFQQPCLKRQIFAFLFFSNTTIGWLLCLILCGILIRVNSPIAWFLSPYAPNLNPIERLWKFLRKQVINSWYYALFLEFRHRVMGFFSNILEHKSRWS